MSEPSDGAIFLRLGPSPRLAGVLAGLHGGALACAFSSDLPAAIKGALAILVIGSAWHSVLVHGLRRVARSIVLLALDRRGQWRLVRRDGRVLDARLAPGGFSHPLLVVLVFRVHGGGTAAFTILPDAAPHDALRRLRVRLRCEPPRRS